jgi:hypothetical protein
MITNIGKNLIGKYLVGQSTQYASHIAIGCGAKPITLATSYGDYSNKTELDFEMERALITSRSYISDKVTAQITNVQVFNGIPDTVVFTVSSSLNGIFIPGQTIVVKNVPVNIGGTNVNGVYIIESVNGTSMSAAPQFVIAPTSNASVATTGTFSGYLNKISLIAELPIDNRYEITEIALWSDLSNPIPSGIDSKNIFNFGRSTEGWFYTTGEGIASNLVYTETALDNGNILNNFDTPANFTTTKAFLTNSGNTFFNSTRIARQERPRFLDDALMVAGDLSKFEVTGGTTILNSLDPANLLTNDYLTISNVNFGDLDTNSATDELVLAYSLISKLASATTLGTIESVNIMVEFLTDIDGATAQYHFRQRTVAEGTTPALSATNRYQTIRVPLNNNSAVSRNINFQWKFVTSARVYASLQTSSGTQVTTHFIALDGLNLVNKNNLNNSNYGMVAYVPVKNSSGVSMLKETNNPNLVEFRLAIGTLGV